MGEFNVSAEDLLSYQEAAEVLGTAPAFVERLVAQRRISHLKLGHYVRIRRSDLDVYIEQSRVPAAGSDDRCRTLKMHVIFSVPSPQERLTEPTRYFYLWQSCNQGHKQLRGPRPRIGGDGDHLDDDAIGPLCECRDG
ncbi:MAG: helix-turn-helix domain-containing protein [Nocardioidaceae bacterium]